MSTNFKPKHPTITINRISTIDTDSKKIQKLMQGLNSSKAYGHDRILILILEVCGPSVMKHLSLLFSNCLTHGLFPGDAKKNKYYYSLKKMKINK